METICSLEFHPLGHLLATGKSLLIYRKPAISIIIYIKVFLILELITQRKLRLSKLKIVTI